MQSREAIHKGRTRPTGISVVNMIVAKTSIAKIILLYIRDAKFRPSSPTGLKIRASPGFLRNPNKQHRVRSRTRRGDHNVLCVEFRASCGA